MRLHLASARFFVARAAALACSARKVPVDLHGDYLIALVDGFPAGRTSLVTNIEFEAWAGYLGNAPLAMALLYRLVDGATSVKLQGKSYRVHRGANPPADK